LPQVILSPSSYAEQLIASNSCPTSITINNAKISSMDDRFKLDIGPWDVSHIDTYCQVQVSLQNEYGKRGPYIVSINVINTPPRFKGKEELSVVGEVLVRLKETFVMPLPDMLNIENQTLSLSLTDYNTSKPLPFITVNMENSSLSFEPKNRAYEGNHTIRLVLSDNLGTSTEYLLNM
jgi:hypothetical protein